MVIKTVCTTEEIRDIAEAAIKVGQSIEDYAKEAIMERLEREAEEEYMREQREEFRKKFNAAEKELEKEV